MTVLERFRRPRVRKAAIAAGALLALWAFTGFFILPAVLRPVVERSVARALHRKATLREMSINPFALSVTLKALDVKDRDGTSPFLSFESLYVNAEASSILHGGPVLSAITLVKPSVSLARNVDGTYSVQDLIEEFSKPAPKDEKPLRFSLNNIRLEGGSVDFDDRPKKTRHTVRDLVVGIPFLSNIPSRVEITTLPVFEAKVNGSPFALHGRTKPFSETRETTLDLDLTDVDLPYYLAYAPSDVSSKLLSARLDAKLVLAFTQPANGGPALVLSGMAALRKVAVELQGKPLLFSEVTVSLKDFTTAPGRPAALDVSMKTDAGEVLRSSGTVSVEPVALAGTFLAEGVSLKRYQAFLDEFVGFVVDDGVLALKTGYRFSTGKDADTTLSDLDATIASPRLRKKGDTEPFFRAATLAMTAASLDVGRRTFAIGDLTSTAGVLAVVREKGGNADLMELGPKSSPSASPPPPSAPWEVTLKRAALHGYTVKMDDRSMSRPARYALTKTDVVLEDFSTSRGSKGKLAVRFGVDGKGVASANGAVGFKPMFADLGADVKDIDLVPIEAYVLQNLRLDLARGSVSAAGRIAIHEDGEGKASVVYTGDALVANLVAVDEATKLDLLKWESFSASGMKAGYNPLFLEIAQLAAVAPSCDVTIETDGTVNLRKVVGAPAAKDDDAEETAPAPGEATPAPTRAPGPAAAPSRGARDTGPAMPVRIDEITLQGGRIGLADHFVKPGFSATLGDLGGRVTGVSSADGTVAALDLRGRLASRSPLVVTGTINPLAAATFADVKASFTDIDLPAFTPYSGTYAGYAIASGTLTVEVDYKIVNRRLTASNRFLVNQFEFGDKVESKRATKLPVKFAVSLLKNKDGVIDLDLPIEGSLDDPKFRIGKIVWQVLGNVIAKAATSPFALLGRMFGGKGDDLSAVDFPNGLATLDEPAKRKLDALARALRDRPALRLEVTGRFSGDDDREALRSLRVERKIKAQKLAELARKGSFVSRVDDVVVEAAECEAYLKKAYRNERFPKPRTSLGLAKDLPAGEIERLMLENEVVGGDELRQLALARADAVKDYLAGPGAADPARVLVLEPGMQAATPKDKARASGVDFSLK